MLSPERISIELSNKESLVLLEFLARLAANESLSASLFVDQAEQRVLWDLECLLEKQLVEPLSPDYQRLLKEARDGVRDPPLDEN